VSRHRASVVLAVLAAAIAAGSSAAQSIICCNRPVNVRGNWIGSATNVDCADYARSHPLDRGAICFALEYCPDVPSFCADCTDPYTYPRGAYAMGSDGGGTTFRRSPSADAEVVRTPPRGTRVALRERRDVEGVAWYRVSFQGGEFGWTQGENIECARPRTTPRPEPTLPSDWYLHRVVPAISSAGRG